MIQYAIEAMIICRGESAIEVLKQHGASDSELAYARYIVRKLALTEKSRRYIEPKWRRDWNKDN